MAYPIVLLSCYNTFACEFEKHFFCFFFTKDNTKYTKDLIFNANKISLNFFLMLFNDNHLFQRINLYITRANDSDQLQATRIYEFFFSDICIITDFFYFFFSFVQFKMTFTSQRRPSPRKPTSALEYYIITVSR